MRSPLRSIIRLLSIAAAFAILTPGPALAQIGGAINKAKQKATEAAVPAKPAEQGCTTPQFDKDVIELTAERIDRVIKGVQAMRAETGPGGKSAAQLRDQAAAAFEERDKLLQGKEDQAARYTDAENAWQSCRSEVLDSLHRQHGPEAQQRLMQMAAGQDASALQAVMDAQTAAVNAMAQGDTIAYNKHMSAYWKAMGIDYAKDTAAADRTCKKPVKPAWLVRADSLGPLGNKLLDDARALETRAAAKGAEIAGMGQQQFAMAQERIAAYVGSEGGTGSRWCYSAKEREALNAKMKELKALKLQ